MRQSLVLRYVNVTQCLFVFFWRMHDAMCILLVIAAVRVGMDSATGDDMALVSENNKDAAEEHHHHHHHHFHYHHHHHDSQLQQQEVDDGDDKVMQVISNDNISLARVVLQQRSCARSTPLIEQLHWRIRFKLTTLTYKALHTGRPPYLAELLQLHRTVRTPKVCTRSSSSQLLLFHVIVTYHLVHGLSASLPLKFGIPYLFTLDNHNHSPHSDAI